MKKTTVLRALVMFSLLSGGIEPASAAFQCGKALRSAVFVGLPPQFSQAVKRSGMSAASPARLHERAQFMTRLFNGLTDSVTVRRDVRFREVPMQGMNLPTAPVKSVFRDFDPATEIIIGAQQENIDGRSHSYMLVGGQRFDGAAYGDRSWEPRRSNLIIAGVVWRVRGLPPKAVADLTAAVEANPGIRDINCFSALVRMIEKNTELRLRRPQAGLPLLPTEIMAALMTGNLVNRAGQPVTVETVNLTPLDFGHIIQRFLQYENQVMIPDPADIYVRLRPTTTNYHREQGW